MHLEHDFISKQARATWLHPTGGKCTARIEGSTDMLLDLTPCKYAIRKNWIASCKKPSINIQREISEPPQSKSVIHDTMRFHLMHCSSWKRSLRRLTHSDLNSSSLFLSLRWYWMGCFTLVWPNPCVLMRSCAGEGLSLSDGE